MSESLFLINPKRRRRNAKRRQPAALRKYWASRRKNPRGKRRHKVHMRHRRRNPRRHRARRRHNPMFHRRRHRNPRRRHHARHHYRRHRNPRRRRNPFGGQTWGAVLTPAAIGVGGAIALAIAYGYLAPYLPSQLTTGTLIPVLVQGAAAVGLGALAYAITKNSRMSNFVAIGGLTVVGVNFVTPYISSATGGNLPGMSGFGGLKLGGVGDYVPYRRPAMGAYMSRQPMGAYMNRQRLGFINPAPRLGAYAATRRMGAYLPNPVVGMRGFGGNAQYTGLHETDSMGM